MGLLPPPEVSITISTLKRPSGLRRLLDLRYYVEPVQGIARAHNRGVGEATGRFIAFIDDDEWPDPRWLVELWTIAQQSQADAVIGPVLAVLPESTPRWLVAGEFFQRPIPETGRPLQSFRNGMTSARLSGRKRRARRLAKHGALAMLSLARGRIEAFRQLLSAAGALGEMTTAIGYRYEPYRDSNGSRLGATGIRDAALGGASRGA